MCVICVSEKGIKQPTKETMKLMWNKNPHGAGYMYQRDGAVYVKKGFMRFDDFYAAVKAEHFTADDPVIYHFRISTQGGINPEMTQPFFYTKDLKKTKCLSAKTKLGICHNGIIPLTSYSDPEYSDTAHFVAEYLPYMVKSVEDVYKEPIQDILEELLHSKMAFLDCNGNVTLIGAFVEEADGLIYSNSSYKLFANYFTKPVAV